MTKCEAGKTVLFLGRKCSVCKKSFRISLGGEFLSVKCNCGTFTLETMLFLGSKENFEIQSNLFRSCFSAHQLEMLKKAGFLRRKEEKGKYVSRVYYAPTRKFKSYIIGLRRSLKVMKIFFDTLKRIEQYL